jgi:hypothetical protein
MFTQIPLPTVDEMEDLHIRLVIEKLQKEQEEKEKDDETDRV